MRTPHKIIAICLVDRENKPIFFKNYCEEFSSIELEFSAFSSLDTVYHRIKTKQIDSNFLGSVCKFKGLTVYGWLAYDMTCVLAVVEETKEMPKDIAVPFLSKVYSIYIDSYCSPFCYSHSYLSDVAAEKLKQMVADTNDKY
ncbi:Trafficking protein particle complex subunit 2 like protein [Aduncisulcus paluster]|uniref:Trafficking protein particle complex subunit 2 like protein n=1 Tax=Aduncisulcus paluster TaxID=2918883 RepID=A0ABQ5JVB9_9EUKA|nr:Trafficking protein particle complex subunit 2 like protein [Aduncisulcus paluster]